MKLILNKIALITICLPVLLIANDKGNYINLIGLMYLCGLIYVCRRGKMKCKTKNM